MPPSTRLSRDRDRSLFAELGRLGVSIDDVPRAWPARTIDPARDRPLGGELGLDLVGRPVFWLQDGQPVVDAAWFGDLAVVDATSLPRGGRLPVGRLVGAADPAEVARLLVQADVVLTWAHLESTLEVRAEPAAGGREITRFTGQHVYFTGRRNVGRLDFSVEIGADGRIQVVDRTP